MAASQGQVPGGLCDISWWELFGIVVNIELLPISRNMRYPESLTIHFSHKFLYLDFGLINKALSPREAIL